MRTIKPYRRKSDWDGLKLLIAVICGILAAIGVFSLDSHIIHSLTSGVENHDLKIVLRIILWIVSFGITLFISILVGWLVGGIINILLGGKF